MNIEESPYKFDGYDGESLLLEEPHTLLSRTVPSEQHTYFEYAHPDTDGYDGFDKVFRILVEPIGKCMIYFSELEEAIEVHLHELISDRSDQIGRMITRDMTYIQKVNLYVDYLRANPYGSGAQYKKDIDMLKKHLVRAAEVRNIIAHAKWPSITEDGYVFSRVQAIASVGSVPELKYYLLNKTALENSRAYMGAVGNFPQYIREKYPA